ncbi:MAG: SDR family NAD(P)-dependent oxidoreductase [Rhodocyclaceae bacterium]|jgi:NAD(P)-dependent dehydrogenase (short-subunit alcohol dehydrogenase family)|nr:SDR family NAD(P)-dependent oxidoreductase [Rhodocyclaceae bacterium]
MKALEGKIALVTGASRGVGKGVALALGEAGATVYITGRTATRDSQGGIWMGEMLPGSLEETAEEVTKRGGTGIPVGCDHRDDEQVRRVFERIRNEQGKLDILVNNAFMSHESIAEDKCFWEVPIATWDNQQTVGLRSAYVASVYAAQMMVPVGHGLIVNISSPVAAGYIYQAAYGVVKAGLDRLSGDMAYELKPYGIASVSLWPGPIGTEKTKIIVSKMALSTHESKEESPFHVGLAVAALAADAKVMEKTGSVLITAELGEEYGFTEEDGSRPINPRQMLWGPPPPAVYKIPKRKA